MPYYGDYATGGTVDFTFTTVDGGGSVAAFGGGSVAVYKANGTVESTAGVTLTPDFDGRTGLNHVRITTGSDGTFYAAGNDFNVVVTAGSASTTPITGYTLGAFSLDNRSSSLTAAHMNQIADSLLRRSLASAEDSATGDAKAFRSLLGAAGKLVNKVAISGSTLTIYETDDVTSLGTQAVTTSAAADPITALDTA